MIDRRAFAPATVFVLVAAFFAYFGGSPATGSDLPPSDVEAAAGEFPILDEARQAQENALSRHEMALGTDVEKAADGEIVVENEVAAPLDANGYSQAPQPERLVAAGASGGWSEYDLGAEYGVIRFQLVGRNSVEPAPSDIAEGESELLVEDVTAAGADVVTLVTGTAIEEFVRVPTESLAEDAALTYVFQIPPKLQLRQKDDGRVVIEDEIGLAVFEVTAPVAQDESGEKSEPQLDVVGENRVSVTVPESADKAVGDLLIDPLFGNPGIGTWTYSTCSAQNNPSCTYTKVGYNADGFPAGSGWDSPYSPYFNIGYHTAVWGSYVGNATTASIPAGQSRPLRWYAPSGNYVSSIAAYAHVNNANGKFSCRFEIGDGTYQSAAATATGGYYFGVSGAGDHGAIRQSTTAATGTISAVNSQRCGMNGSGDYFTLGVTDPYGPVVTAPYSTPGQGSGGAFSVFQPGNVGNTPWHGPNSVGYFRVYGVDRGQSISGPIINAGSGIASYSVVLNGDDTSRPSGSYQYALVNRGVTCSPGSYGDQRPCPNVIDGGTHYVRLGDVPGLAVGSNTVRTSYWDYSGRVDVSAVGAFRYDPLPATFYQAPEPISAYLGPASADDDGGTIALAAPVGDPHSGIQSWSVTKSTGGTVCSGTAASLDEGLWIDCTMRYADFVNDEWVRHAGVSDGPVTFTFRVVDNVGNVATWAISTSIDFTPPAAPTVAFSTAGGPLSLGWSSSDATSPIANYDVCFGISEEGCQDQLGYVAKGLATSISGYFPPRQYFGAAQALDAAGNWSAGSAIVETTIDPIAPNAPGTPTVTTVPDGSALATWPAVTPSLTGQIQTVGYEACVGTPVHCSDSANFVNYTPVPSIVLRPGEGTKQVWVRTVDEGAGRSTPSAASGSFTIVSAKPVVGVVGGVPPTVRADTTLTLSATASHPTSPVGVTFQSRSAGGAWVNIETDLVPPYSASYFTSANADGEVEFRAIATNTATGDLTKGTGSTSCFDRANLAEPTDVKHRWLGSPVTAAQIHWAPPALMTGIAGYIVMKRDSQLDPWATAARVAKNRNAVTIPATSTDEFHVEAVGRMCTDGLAESDSGLEEPVAGALAVNNITTVVTSATTGTPSAPIPVASIDVTGDGQRYMFIHAWAPVTNPNEQSILSLRDSNNTILQQTTGVGDQLASLVYRLPPFSGTKTIILGVARGNQQTTTLHGGNGSQYGLRAVWETQTLPGGLSVSEVSNTTYPGVDSTVTVTGDGSRSAFVEVWGVNINGTLQLRRNGQVISTITKGSGKPAFHHRFPIPPFTGTDTFDIQHQYGIAGSSTRQRGLRVAWGPDEVAGGSSRRDDLTTTSIAAGQVVDLRSINVTGDPNRGMWITGSASASTSTILQLRDESNNVLQRAPRAAAGTGNPVRLLKYYVAPFSGERTFKLSATGAISHSFPNAEQALLATWIDEAVVATSVLDETDEISPPIAIGRLGLASASLFSSEYLGGGAVSSINNAGGNHLVRKALSAGKGRGFDTSPTLTHNSQDPVSHEGAVAGTGLGIGSTLGLSGLADTDDITSFSGIALEPLVKTSGSVILREDDGASSEFTSAAGGIYAAPAGKFLYVRDVSITGEAVPAWAPSAVFAATRPDRVTYWYADYDANDLPAKDGRLLGVSDRNGLSLATGAQLRILYECVDIESATGNVTVAGAGNCASYTATTGHILRHRIASVRDAGDRDLVFDYYNEAAGAPEANRDGRLKSLTDFGGTVYRIDYDALSSDVFTAPRISAVRDAYGTSLERTTTFQHELNANALSSDVDASQLITGVVDPRGATTKFKYGVVDDDGLARVTEVIDRVDSAGEHDSTRFNYGVDDGVLNGTTTVSDELDRKSTYRFDSRGRVIGTATAAGVRTRFAYNGNDQVVSTRRLLREDDSVTLTGTAPQPLAENVSDGTEVLVRSAKNQQGTAYVEGVDYIVTTVAGATIARTSTSSIPSGQPVYVSFAYSRSVATWDPKTGYEVTSQVSASLKRDAAGVAIAPTAGELAPATVTTYTNDTALNGYVADVATVTTPRGTATTGNADDFKTTYTYDANLRVQSVVSPINAGSGAPGDLATRSYTYDALGNTTSATDATNATIEFAQFDPSGQARVSYKAVKPGDPPAPVESVTLYDAMGRTTCLDSKREVGDSLSVPVSDNACQSSATNKTFDTTSYDALGRVTVGTSPWNETHRRASWAHYDANGNATSSRANIAYPAAGTPSDSGGAVTSATYDALDRPVRNELPANDDEHSERISTARYDVADRVIQETQPQGNVTAASNDYSVVHSYDEDDREIRSANGNGEVTCTWYDRLGRAVAQSEPMALAIDASCPSSVPSVYVTSTTYDRADNAVASIDPSGRQTKSTYDDEGNAVKNTDSANNTTTVVADPEGNARQVIEPLMNACTDAETCASTAPIAPTSTTTYDGEGNVTAEKDARATAESAAPGDNTTTYAYDADGQLIKTALPTVGSDAETFMHTKYDGLGNVVETTTQTGEATTAAALSDAGTTTWTAAPDGSITGKTDDATGTSYSVTYAIDGQMATRTEHGVTTYWSYYDDGSLRTEERTTLAKAWEPNRRYAVGQCVNPTGGNTSTYEVAVGGTTGASEPTWSNSSSITSGSVTFASGTCKRVTNHYYDRNGQEDRTVVTQAGTTQESKVTRRDNVGRVLNQLGLNDPSSTTDDAAATTATTYDRNGHEITQIQNQRRTTSTYGTGSTTNLLVSQSIGFVAGGADMSADFGYDDAGNLTSIVRKATKPIRTELTYDSGNRLTRVLTCVLAANAACSTNPNATVQDIGYTFDVAGNIRVKRQRIDQVDAKKWEPSKTYALGDTVAGGNGHQYLVTAAGTTPADPSFSSGAALPTVAGSTVTTNNVTLQEFTMTTSYGYDGQNRLVLEDRPNNPNSLSDYDRKYEYDADGRLDRIVNADCTSGDAVAEKYHYSAITKGQLVGTEKWAFSPASGACSRALAADTDITFGTEGSSQEGAMTSIVTDNAGGADKSVNLQQGDDNLVSAITVDGNTSAITRDDQGRILTAKSETSGESVKLTYAGDDRQVATVQPGDDSVATGVLTAPNGWIIAEQRDPAGYSRYLLTDHLGTPIGEFGKSGVQKSSYSYDAYGQADPLQSSGDADTTVGFTGQQVDPATGFTNNDARQYDPSLRTWITTDQYSDPSDDMDLATDAANANRLAYAGGNPITNTDPDGHAIRQGNNIVQVTGGRSKIITVEGKKRGRTISGSAASVKAQVSAIQRQEQRMAATKARWLKNPKKIAMDQRRAKREALQARIDKAKGRAQARAREVRLLEAQKLQGDPLAEAILGGIAGGGVALAGKLGVKVASSAGASAAGGSSSKLAGRYLLGAWSKGTFPNRTQSVIYHLNKHGKGRSATEYTQDAMRFFHDSSGGTIKRLRNGQAGIKIGNKKQGGIYTLDGKLVTYWD